MCERPERAARRPWRLALALAPFTMGAAAINLFMLGLLVQAIGVRAATPGEAALCGALLGGPLAWPAALWVRRLIGRAEGGG